MVTLAETYTTAQVTRMFRGVLKTSTLQDWDRRKVLRPTRYYDRHGEKRLLTRSERDELVAEQGTSTTNPERRYTYTDLVKIRLFFHVSNEFQERRIPNPRRKASGVLKELWAKCEGVLPAASRLVFLGSDVYLLSDATPPLCLTRPDEQALDQVLMDFIEPEVKGRIAALHGHDAATQERKRLVVG